MSSWPILNNLLWLVFYIIKCWVIYRIARFVYNLGRIVWIYWIAPKLGIRFKFEQYKDKWTVVTGSTDGIGKEYLYQLAAKGLKRFLLISRDKRKLQNTADWLLNSFPNCEIKIQPFTFGKDDYSVIREVIEPLDIGILVNNAGTGPELLYRFTEDTETDRMVYKVNTESVFEMMQIVLPKLKLAKCGAIINVSSVQSIRPITLLASYSASKAYVSHVTECAHREYKKDGITVQCLIPIVVDTKIMKYRRDDIPIFDGIILVSAKRYAEEAINTLGVVNYTTGCAWQDFQYAVIYILPWWILRMMAEPYYRGHRNRLQRGNKKKLENLDKKE